ncbi:D-hexose-6-phosphate mutarotase [Cellulomonas fimi]|uniref:Putative glucose-6-phosphate 1-epimerase n=1 Tax=Cellulomonas fimi TaxID=1708 RepID=A0A7Y0M182_CELFI|nr:D-hexose-6-phosphate mutarotase [Cellulomonas fimi]NMR21650.1 D-hexose-6-phosphate mutarotase [Cellulomonas fimi]
MSALPPSIRLESGPGGLARLRVEGVAGEAVVYTHGAHVAQWNPVDADPVLWLSRRSRFTRDTAIRGGVPICFPWFGPHPGRPDLPSHGFARLAEWSLLEAREVDDDVVLAFRLTDTEATRASAWPHRFDATYTVRVGAELTLELHVTNLDDHELSYEEALHTYLAVADVRATRVTGLEGTPYVDKLGGPDPVRSDEAVTFTGETDRVYLDTGPITIVEDVAGRRAVTVTKHGSGSTVLWNPWIEKTAATADLGDDDWTGMVCVETANVGGAEVRLAPGASHALTATLAVARLA